MSDRSELLAELYTLQNQVEFYKSVCKNYERTNQELMTKIKSLQEKDRWIPTEERTPTLNDVDWRWEVQTWRLGCVMNLKYDQVRKENASHWKRLPKGPEVSQ